MSFGTKDGTECHSENGRHSISPDPTPSPNQPTADAQVNTVSHSRCTCLCSILVSVFDPGLHPAGHDAV